MLFNSYAFLLEYLPIVFIVFFILSKKKRFKAAKAWLLMSSLYFYAYWDIRFLPLLLGSILFNYMCGSSILSKKNSRTRKSILTLGVISNLSLLFYFKYYGFFISQFYANTFIETVLPLGISFFTFTQIAYLVDAYQNKAEACDLVSYGLFVTIFPHLIAGPILHHKEMIKQFTSPQMFTFNWSNIEQGIFLFTIGLLKKVLIADNLAVLAKPIFDKMIDPIPLIQAWLGALSYTFQLYFDFSGYSDMAVGLGLLFGLYLPINFNSPYQADSIIDFWRRWHITLSQFLRDYLYIPLGGSRGGKFAKLRNLMITMLLGGLWHGAGWTFILWGACHGTFLVINHLWRDLKISIPSWLARAITLLAVICAWVIFRSPSIEQAFNILKGMIGLNGIVLPESYLHRLGFLKSYGVVFGHIADSKFRLLDLLALMTIGIMALKMPNSNHLSTKFKTRPLTWSFACAVIFVLCFLNLGEITEFLYYQF